MGRFSPHHANKTGIGRGFRYRSRYILEGALGLESGSGFSITYLPIYLPTLFNGWDLLIEMVLGLVFRFQKERISQG